MHRTKKRLAALLATVLLLTLSLVSCTGDEVSQAASQAESGSGLPVPHLGEAELDGFQLTFVIDSGDSQFHLSQYSAGELLNASAVVGDIFDIVRYILAGCCGRIGCTCYRECPIKRVGEIKSKYFVRMQIENRYGTLASVASVFGNNKVSIAQMLQKRVNG